MENCAIVLFLNGRLDYLRVLTGWNSPAMWRQSQTVQYTDQLPSWSQSQPGTQGTVSGCSSPPPPPPSKKKNHQDFVCLVTVDIFLNHRLLSQGAFMEGKSKICASSLWMEVRLKLCATTHIYGDRPYCDVRKGRWNAHRSLVIFFLSSGDLEVK